MGEEDENEDVILISLMLDYSSYINGHKIYKHKNKTHVRRTVAALFMRFFYRLVYKVLSTRTI